MRAVEALPPDLNVNRFSRLVPVHCAAYIGPNYGPGTHDQHRRTFWHAPYALSPSHVCPAGRLRHRHEQSSQRTTAYQPPVPRYHVPRPSFAKEYRMHTVSATISTRSLCRSIQIGTANVEFSVEAVHI
ncbi:hypothetical protein FKP32DRAFT_1590352 [Trametes sanguinea]|nr:hypothetical protein FKP32DRAFT_1590352 [Trametes sanguinea]